MNAENQDKLFEEFPDLFRRDLLPLGFECQDGWFSLLHELAVQLQGYLRRDRSSVKPKILMVKQHMGELRIEAFGGDDAVRKMIRRTQEKAKTVCELDGEPAIGLFVCAPYWYRCLCKRCAKLHECMKIEDLRQDIYMVAAIEEFHLREINVSEELFL